MLYVLRGPPQANPKRDLTAPCTLFRPLIWGYPSYLVVCAPDHYPGPSLIGIASIGYGCLPCLVPGHLLDNVVLGSKDAFWLRLARRLALFPTTIFPITHLL